MISLPDQYDHEALACTDQLDAVPTHIQCQAGRQAEPRLIGYPIPVWAGQSRANKVQLQTMTIETTQTTNATNATSAIAASNQSLDTTQLRRQIG